MAASTFLPALRWRILAAVYDVTVALTAREPRCRRLLVAELGLTDHPRVLDLGCGTGNLAIAIKAELFRASVVALDADDDILELARSKAAAAGVAIDFRRFGAPVLPLKALSFDAVASAFLFHNLRPDDKARLLREVFRVLRPGGMLHVADWGRPAGPVARLRFLPVRLFDGFEVTRASARGTFPDLLRGAGFRPVRETHRLLAPLGTVRIWRAEKPVPETR